METLVWFKQNNIYYDIDIDLTELNALASGDGDVSGLLRYTNVGPSLTAGEDDEEIVETTGFSLRSEICNVGQEC